MSNNQERKLAAILFADIVGYTALMQQGESKAMSILDRFKEVTNDKVSQHRGEVIKTYGDGSLILFDSTVDAVQCAHDMQVAFREGIEVPLRIGVHVGEVIKKDHDIFGNGVNIAARVESMGIAGAVLMSADVRRRIKNQEHLTTQSLGHFEFKNVEETIEVFALANDGFPIPKKEEITGKFKEKVQSKKKSALSTWWPLIAALFLAYPAYYFWSQSDKTAEPEMNKKSIAVLPFTDLSPQKDQEYFSVGMMDEILNHLVKIEDLQVSSRTSSMQYLNTTTPITEISKTLGAANVLEGSVRKAGDQVRITVQLINGITDKHLWSETYDREFKDIFTIQSDVAQQIAATLEAQIYPEVKARIEALPTTNMEAYDMYLKGKNRSFGAYTSVENEQYFLNAIEIDSNFSQAYAQVANIWLNRGGFAGSIDRNELIPNVQYYLNKALETDPNNAYAHRQKAQFALWYQRDYETAEEAWNACTRLNPSSINGTIIDYYSSMGRFEEAKAWADRLNVMYEKTSNGWDRRGQPYYLAGDYETSIEYIETALEKFPGNWFIKSEGVRWLFAAGYYERVIELLNTEDGNHRFPRNLGYLAMAKYKLGDKQSASNLLDKLLLKSEEGPLGSPSFYIAMIYAQMGDTNKAFEYIQRSIDNYEVELYWLKVEPPFEPLRSDPRWPDMLRKVGFNQDVKG